MRHPAASPRRPDATWIFFPLAVVGMAVSVSRRQLLPAARKILHPICEHPTTWEISLFMGGDLSLKASQYTSLDIFNGSDPYQDWHILVLFSFWKLARVPFKNACITNKHVHCVRSHSPTSEYGLQCAAESPTVPCWVYEMRGQRFGISLGRISVLSSPDLSRFKWTVYFRK